MSFLAPILKKGQKLAADVANAWTQAVRQISPDSVTGKGVKLGFKKLPDLSVELDFEIFGFTDVKPNSLIYQKGETWTKEGVSGGSPYRVPQAITKVQKGNNNQETRLVRVVPVKPQEKIRLICDSELYDNIKASPTDTGKKPTRSQQSLSKIADAVLAKWDGEKLIAASEDDYDFTIFQISKSSPVTPPPKDSKASTEPTYFAEAVYRGGVGGGTSPVITRIVCDEMEGCRVIEPIIGNFFLIDVPITLIEKDEKGNYTQFITSSFSPLPVSTDSYGHAVTNVFSNFPTSSLHYRRTIFSNMGTIATHSLAEYEPMRPTYVGGESFSDIVYSWKPPDWDSETGTDTPTLSISKKRIRGECRYWQEEDTESKITPASPRHPYYLLKREPAVTDGMVAIRQADLMADNGYHWRYINGKHFGKGSPFDNSKADDFNALYFTTSTITTSLDDPITTPGNPTGNVYAIDTKPFCIGSIPSLIPHVEFDGKMDILPFLAIHSARWDADLTSWIDTTYHTQSGSSGTTAMAEFSFINNSQSALRTVRDTITSRPFGSYGETFMYQQLQQLDTSLLTLLLGYTYDALSTTANGFGTGFPLIVTATVKLATELPDPVITAEGTTYRVGSGIGSYQYYRVIANTWVEANTSLLFTIPTGTQFATAFTANWNSRFNSSFLVDFQSQYQTVLQNLFTRFNELYPSALHTKIVEAFPTFISEFNKTFVTDAMDGSEEETFFYQFKNDIENFMSTDQSFNDMLEDALLEAYPESDYPNTGQYTDIATWRSDKKQAVITFILDWFDAFKKAIQLDLAIFLKEATVLAYAITPSFPTSPVYTPPFSSTLYSPVIVQPADPTIQLQSYFDPVDYNTYTRAHVIALYSTEKIDSIIKQCRTGIQTDFTTEFNKYHDNSIQTSWLYLISKSLTDSIFSDIENLYNGALSQTFAENTTSAIINKLLTTGQSLILYSDLAATTLEWDLPTEFQDWMGYVFSDGADYSTSIPTTNPINSNAYVKLELSQHITNSLTAATTAMTTDPASGPPDTSPLQTIKDTFYTSLYDSCNNFIESAILITCVESGIPLLVNYDVSSFSDLELYYPAQLETLDTTARVGSVGSYSFYRVSASSLAENEWTPMTVVTSTEFNQKLNARFSDLYDSVISTSFSSYYDIACNAYRTQFFEQYKDKLVENLTKTRFQQSSFGTLLEFLCNSISINGYTTLTKELVKYNRYSNKSSSNTPQPLTFCEYATKTLIDHIDKKEQSKIPNDRSQLPWRPIITLIFRDIIVNSLHDKIRATIDHKFNPLFGGSYQAKNPNVAFQTLDFTFTPNFSVGVLDHVDFESVNLPTLRTTMRTQLQTHCTTLANSLTPLFNQYLTEIPNSTPPDDPTYPDGSKVTWTTLERDNILVELKETLLSYFSEVVANFWTFEQLINYFSDTPVHPISPQNWEWTKAPEKAQRHLPLALCPTADPCETLVPGEKCQFIEKQATYSLPAVDIYNNPLYVQELDSNGILQDTSERKYDTYSFTYAEIVPPVSYMINPEGTGQSHYIKYTAEEMEVWTPPVGDDRPSSTEIKVNFKSINASDSRDLATPMDGFMVSPELTKDTSNTYSNAKITNKYGVVNDLKSQDPRGIFYKTDNCGRLYPCAFRIETAPYGYGVRATWTYGSYYSETDTCAPEFINDSATITRTFLDNRTFLATHPATQWHHTLTMCSEPPIPSQ